MSTVVSLCEREKQRKSDNGIIFFRLENASRITDSYGIRVVKVKNTIYIIPKHDKPDEGLFL
jgi:hypothetical protein